MTVNITINADTLEITQVDDMTRIVCGGEDKKRQARIRVRLDRAAEAEATAVRRSSNS